MLLFLAQISAANCLDVELETEEALQNVLRAETAAAFQSLKRAEEAMGCSSVSSEQIARYWLVEAAAYFYDDDKQTAQESLVAARRTAPSVWIEALGPELRGVYEGAREPAELGKVRLEPERDVLGWIDGRPKTFPTDLVQGLHLLQLGAEGEVRTAQIVYVTFDANMVIEHDLPAKPDVVEVVKEEPPPEEPGEGPAVWGWLGAGVGFAAGTELQADIGTEPASHISVPVDASVAFGGRGWVRAGGQFSLLLNGQYLFAASDGEPATMPGLASLHLTGGADLGSLDVGALVGTGFPARTLMARGIAGMNLDGPLGLEARLGVNAPTQRPVEPAAELLVSLSLR